MKHLICLLASIVVLCSTATAQELAWQKSFGGAFPDVGLNVTETSDGGLLAIGYTSSFKGDPAAVRSGYLIRTDADGELVWQKGVGAYHMMSVNAVFNNGDDTYTLIGGGLVDMNIPTLRLYMARIDDEGTVIWEKPVGDSTFNPNIVTARQRSSGGFVVLADGGAGKPYLAHIADDGEVQWEKTFALVSGDGTEPTNVRELRDGGFVVIGRDGPGMYLLKVSAAGDSLWRGDYWRSGATDRGEDVIEKPDGSLLLIGYSDDASIAPVVHLYLIHTDRNGVAIEGIRVIRDTRMQIHTVENTEDGGMILAGSIADGGSYNAYFMRTDVDGKVLWEFGHRSGTEPHYNTAVRQLSDGSYVGVGNSGSEVLITRITGPVSAVEEARPVPASINLW